MEHHSLIERIKSRDSDEGLREIYTSYRNEFLLWAVRHHKCTMDEAKDVFQQSVIIFYENIVNGKLTEITTQVKTYIFSIGKNKILELLRLKKKQMPEFNDQIYKYDSQVDGEVDEDYEEKLKYVEAGLGKLGDPCKSILKHYYYQKKSMVEISEILKYKNSDTVKNLKYKCLQRLRRIIKSDFGIFNDQLI
jgi:RNA polymerase sigma-70 factor (ECF subfamily)